MRTRVGRSTCSGPFASCSAEPRRFRSPRATTSTSDSNYAVLLPHAATLLTTGSTTMGHGKATPRKPTRCLEQAWLSAGIQLAGGCRRRLPTLISTSCIFLRKSG
ncbi:hypothetical protein MTO96_007352 [Rhipicephalus appendiculatus]